MKLAEFYGRFSKLKGLYEKSIGKTGRSTNQTPATDPLMGLNTGILKVTNYFAKKNVIHLVGESRYEGKGNLIVWRKTNLLRQAKVIYRKKLNGGKFDVGFRLGRLRRFNTSLIALGLEVDGKIVDSISYRGEDLAKLIR